MSGKMQLHTWLSQLMLSPFFTTGGSCSKREAVCSNVKGEHCNYLALHNGEK